VARSSLETGVMMSPPGAEKTRTPGRHPFPYIGIDIFRAGPYLGICVHTVIVYIGWYGWYRSARDWVSSLGGGVQGGVCGSQSHILLWSGSPNDLLWGADRA
jgi:hypothetical protein